MQNNEGIQWIKSRATCKKDPIKSDMDCNTINVIYKVDCNYFNKQYISQTTNLLRITMTSHQTDIVHSDKDKPVIKHAIFHKENKIKDCYSLKAIKKVKEN